MVHVAPGIVAQHFLRLLVEAVAGGGIRREHRDGGDVAHGGNAGHVDLSRVASAVEEIELVELARLDERALRGLACVGQPAGGALLGLRRGLGRAGPGGDEGPERDTAEHRRLLFR